MIFIWIIVNTQWNTSVQLENSSIRCLTVWHRWSKKSYKNFRTFFFIQFVYSIKKTLCVGDISFLVEFCRFLEFFPLWANIIFDLFDSKVEDIFRIIQVGVQENFWKLLNVFTYIEKPTNSLYNFCLLIFIIKNLEIVSRNRYACCLYVYLLQYPALLLL